MNCTKYTYNSKYTKQIYTRIPTRIPKLPATKTLISRPPLDDNDHMIENAKSVLWTVQNKLTTANIQNKSTQEFLQDINLHVVLCMAIAILDPLLYLYLYLYV